MKTLNNSKRINSPIYTADSLIECFGKDLSEAKLLSGAIPEFKFDSLMEGIFMNDLNVDEIGLVTIDNECYEWLESKGLENTEENHLLYASEVTDEKMRELWNKHMLNIHYDFQYIPVISFRENNDLCSGNIKLSDESISNLKADIASHYKCNTSDIVILPHAYRIDYAVKNDMKLYSYALDMLQDDQAEILPAGLYEQQNNIDAIERFIGVFIKHDIDCIRDVHNHDIEWDKKHTGYVFNDSTTNELYKDFGNNSVNLLSTLVSSDKIEDYSDQFYEAFKNKSLECF